MRLCWLIAACLVAALSAEAQPEADHDEVLRNEFRAAYQRAQSGETQSDADSEALRSYIIYPYLEAARLSRDLADAAPEWSGPDEAVAAFLTLHEGEPVAAGLRPAWLESLAQRELWSQFLEHYQPRGADTGLRCRYLEARIALDDVNGIAPLILDEWLTPYQLPLTCEPVFQWLRDAGLLDDDATEARVRLLLEAGQAPFARIIASRLPEQRLMPLLAWADFIDKPLAAIETALSGPSGAIEPQVLLEGWSRLARDDPTAALGLYDDLVDAEDLDAQSASPYTLALALGLAWDRRPETLAFFARVPSRDVDDYALGWEARAALWAGQWDVAQRAIAAMSAEQRATAEWRYWGARVADERDERERLYDSLIPDDNFFSAAAAAQRRDPPSIHPETHARDEGMIMQLAALPAIARAGELRRVGLPTAAAREWRGAYAGLDANERDQSIFVARDLGWLDLAVATATERGVFFDYPLLYPRPYAREVEAAADEFDLDPWLIDAVIRQESLYRTDAESSAGALGLMQLTRATVRDIADSLRDPSPASADPLDPATNIRLGAARLARMLERYDGHVVPALAAYNAGPAAVDRWLPSESIDGDIWLENIPYNETREYVRRVLWHSVVFASLEGKRINARQWLRKVEPLQ